MDGINYTFKYKYNERADRLYISIYLNSRPIIEGVKIIENQMLLSQYLVDNLIAGDLVCTRMLGDESTRATLGTIGIGNTYELQYFSRQELGNE